MRRRVPVGELPEGVSIDVEHFLHLLQFPLLVLVVAHQHLLLLVELAAEAVLLPLQLLAQPLVLLR